MAKYGNIRKARLTHQDISDALGYKTRSCFRSSSAHRRIMAGVDELVGKVIENVRKEFRDRLEL